MPMKVLIVILNDLARANLLAQHVSKSIPDAKTVIVNRGVNLTATNVVNDMVRRSGPYDVIVHHCGGTNAEYSDFLRAFRTLSNVLGWKETPIVLFSGSSVSVEQADSAFARDSYVCAVPQVQLEKNLGSFLAACSQASEESKGEGIPWNILLGYSSSEYPLQVLCALLPFGVTWEASGKTNEANGLADSSRLIRPLHFLGLERVIVERLKELIESKLHSNWSSESDKRMELLNNLLAERIDGSKLARRLIGLQDKHCAVRLATPLDSALQILAKSRTLVQWNWRLSILRDFLLE